ncbi:MAG TPA: D-arabinono-1,4-lactone oxidase [Gaiellaceae bacterium]|nr:D-arabinono-1,4-lactone oxidase [Gaiellaceae bacterium]
MLTNWAGNLTYSAARVHRPGSVEEAAELVAASGRIRALGTRHSFSGVADSAGELVSTERLDRVVEVGEREVTVEAGIAYGTLGRALAGHGHGLALPNYASLPHVSVGGAVATGTHGSGVRNRSLAAAVSGLDLVLADGSLLRLRRGDTDFDGAVVALGALGLVVRLTLDVVPAFELRQYVFRDLPWPALEESLWEILAGGYSVSLFTGWAGAAVEQVWVKTAGELPATPYFGARPADGPLHPIPGADPAHCTEQLGVPGPSDERLPHFRRGATPSAGDELQSEYAVDRAQAAAAIRALRPLGPQIAPLLLVSEIRAIAADDLWLSPFHRRDSVAIHFTWKKRPADVLALLPRIEDALAPYEARPHWGKLFAVPPERLAGLYPRLPAFRELAARLDPAGTFANDFVRRTLGA